MSLTARSLAPPWDGAPPLLRPAWNFLTWIGLMLRPHRRTAVHPLWPFTVRLMIAALVIAAAIAATMFFFDTWAITEARALPPGVIAFFRDITNYGKAGWTLWPLGIVMLTLTVVAARRLPRVDYLMVTALFLRLGYLFFAIALPGLFTDLFKGVGRARPFVTGVANPFAYSWLDWRPAYESFPSGHTTAVFAVAVSFGFVWPRLRPALWIYAAAIALSRVVITAHHPSDVMAGALVGTLGAVLVRHWFATRRLVFAIAPDGTIRTMPGPSWRRLMAVARRLAGH